MAITIKCSEQWLFPEFNDENVTMSDNLENHITKIIDPGLENIGLTSELSYSSATEMPIVEAYNGDVPLHLIALYRLNDSKTIEGVCPMFYTDDRRFEWIWRQPLKAVEKLRRYRYVLSPDFSTYLDMPKPIREYNIFRNKVLSALWQRYGINVIPSITWTTLGNITEDLDGWPENSIIAINSTGVGRDKRSKHYWVEGYHAAIDILNPTHILRYGGLQEGEYTGISTYYPNNNRMRYGR